MTEMMIDLLIVVKLNEIKAGNLAADDEIFNITTNMKMKMHRRFKTEALC